MLPAAISVGLRGRTHGQKCQTSDGLRGSRALPAGWWASSLGALGRWKVSQRWQPAQKTLTQGHRRFHSSREISLSQPLCIIWAKLSKTETRNPYWTYPSSCFLYLSLDRYLLMCKSTLEVKLWKQMSMSSAEPEASAAALGPVTNVVWSLEG